MNTKNSPWFIPKEIFLSNFIPNRTILSIVELLNEIVNEINSLDDTRPPAQLNSIPSLCIDFVNKNITNDTSIQTIANTLNVSASHLQFIFKKEIGITLHKYITNQKMQLARKLLMQGEPAQSVAKTLGYEYYSTFFNNYLKRFGIAPTALAEIQRMHWENIDV